MLETVGHYKVLDRIGAGTLGDVYRARDTRLGRTVAVKVPGNSLQADRARLDALAADARAASVLSHPNIAALYEIAQEADGRVFLVFEFVPGEPLRRVIAGRPINVRRAVDLATQIADALADAHAVEMTHGGLTSDTVMVTPKGNAKILDFGFARWTSRPPAAGGDAAADIRALGALLAEMLTGKPARPDAPPAGSSIPPDLTEIVGRALDAGGRGYEAAATCAAELRAVAAVLDARAASGEPVRVVPDRRPRASRLWIVVAALVVLAALVLAWRLL
jgi:serine/threonine-protein kinase